MSEAVRRRCRDHAGDERELRVALVEDLRAGVPFAFHVWLLVDPETEVGTAPLATVPEPLADVAECHVWTIRDGAIHAARFYIDSETVLAALG